MNVVDNKVTIFVKTDDSRITEMFDVDDQIMKAVFASFEILSGLETSDSYIGGPQVVLKMNPIPAVKYATTDGVTVPYEGDSERNVVACATESVLKHLHAADCVGKNCVTFQSRKGSYEAGDIEVSGLIHITFGKQLQFFTMNFEEGIVTNSYAYLTEGRVCLFLNTSDQGTLNKIDSVLEKVLPRK